METYVKNEKQKKTKRKEVNEWGKRGGIDKEKKMMKATKKEYKKKEKLRNLKPEGRKVIVQKSGKDV